MSLSNEGIRTQIALTNPAIRSALRGSLQAKGFRALNDASTMIAVHDAIESGNTDLIITSTQLGFEDTSLLVKEMRHQRLGTNPFIVVMLLLEHADPDLVQTIVSTGADDLLLMPISPGQVLSRVEAMIRARKRFVVTHDYIGPDRRKTDRPGLPQAASFAPPNPLALRSSDIMDESRYQQIIKSGIETLNRTALSVQARQLIWLNSQMTGTGNEPVAPKVRAGCAVQLVHTGQEIARRLHKNHATTHLSTLNDVIELGRKIVDDPVGATSESLAHIQELCSKLSRELSLPA